MVTFLEGEQLSSSAGSYSHLKIIIISLYNIHWVLLETFSLCAFEGGTFVASHFIPELWSWILCSRRIFTVFCSWEEWIPENGVVLPEAHGDKGHLGADILRPAAVFHIQIEVAFSCALDGKQESVQKLLSLCYTSNLWNGDFIFIELIFS